MHMIKPFWTYYMTFCLKNIDELLKFFPTCAACPAKAAQDLKSYKSIVQRLRSSLTGLHSLEIVYVIR